MKRRKKIPLWLDRLDVVKAELEAAADFHVSTQHDRQGQALESEILDVSNLVAKKDVVIMGTTDDALDLRTLLAPRSYRVYQMRTKEKKSFREIGAAIGRTRGLAHALYHGSLRRIELRKSGGETNPELVLKTRAVHCLYKTLDKREITKSEVIEALKSGELRPAGTYGYGWKTHREVCQWAGVSSEECPNGASA